MDTKIKCPECGSVFEISEKDYQTIVKQIRDKEFNNELALLNENKEQEINLMRDKITSEYESKIKEIQNQHSLDIKVRDDQYNALLTYKSSLGTKMIGEELEQYCSNEFNAIRATAFSKAYFEKDNEVVNGTKGDFVFRDYDEEGNEFISIMFDMKNESIVGKTKTKNESHYDTLDKNRNNKKCEYAILVSTLEQGNSLFDNGIVDVSYKYPKMFVIRPQFFIPMITILRNAALNNIDFIKEINVLKNKDHAIEAFEGKLDEFKADFNKSYKDVDSNYERFIKDIDDAIKKLEEAKKAVENYHSKVSAANNKLKKLSIKKLTKDNEIMKNMFDENK